MLRSLYSGVSGMRGFQTKLDVIGNNIANVNTIGFKGGRVMFQDIVAV
jgi:flagellar hook protein FlgE